MSDLNMIKYIKPSWGHAVGSSKDVIGQNELQLTLAPNPSVFTGDRLCHDDIKELEYVLAETNISFDISFNKAFYEPDNAQLTLENIPWNLAPIAFVANSKGKEITKIETYFINDRNEDFIKQIQELYAHKNETTCAVCGKKLSRNKKIYVTANGQLIAERCFKEAVKQQTADNSYSSGLSWSHFYKQLSRIIALNSFEQAEIEQQMADFESDVMNKMIIHGISKDKAYDLLPDIFDKMAEKGNWYYERPDGSYYSTDSVSSIPLIEEITGQNKAKGSKGAKADLLTRFKSELEDDEVTVNDLGGTTKAMDVAKEILKGVKFRRVESSDEEEKAGDTFVILKDGLRDYLIHKGVDDATATWVGRHLGQANDYDYVFANYTSARTVANYVFDGEDNDLAEKF